MIVVALLLFSQFHKYSKGGIVKKSKQILLASTLAGLFLFTGFVSFQVASLKRAASEKAQPTSQPAPNMAADTTPVQTIGCCSARGCHVIEERRVVHVVPRPPRTVVFVQPHPFFYPMYRAPRCCHHHHPQPQASFHLEFNTSSHSRHRHHR